MQKNNKFILWLILLFVSTNYYALLAGVTGKIAGTVSDKETSEPLIGVNIFLVGETIGAATDVNGNYTILNVPPGVYTLSTSFVGYTEVTIKEVKVITDQTTRLDFSLQSELLESDAVVIVAEREIVKQDVATSVSTFSSEEISVIPFSNVEDIVSLQAGVESGFQIRGGGADQALFQVDGVSMRDPRNNAPITSLALSSVEEVSVERGGFNAEYGEVRSGIVKVVTKEGAKSQYNVNVIAKYSPPTRKYFGSSPYDPNSTMLRPFLDDDVAWTGTDNGAWDKYEQAQYPSFEGWNEISRQLLSDNNPDNDLSPAAAQQLFRWQHRKQEVTDQSDYNVDLSLGGPVPFVSEQLGNLRFFTSYRTQREMLLLPLSRPDYKEYNWSMKVNSDISPQMKLTVLAMLGKNFVVAQNEAGLNFSTQYIRSADAVASQIANLGVSRATNARLFSDSYFSAGTTQFSTFSAKITHAISPTTFYDASLEHIATRYNVEPIGLRDYTNNVEFIPGFFTNESPFGYSPEDQPGVDGMLTGGHTSTARDYSEISATTLKFDFSSQVNYYNLLKTGFEFVYNDLNLDYGDVKPEFPEVNVYVKRQHSPLRAALYVQDKLELDGLIVNAGLRLDYSDANTKWASVDTWDKNFYSSNYNENAAFPEKESKAEFSLSPRLSISHPISEKAKLFFNYGHFKQLPTYEQMLRLSRGGDNSLLGIGNPNLEPEKTIAYELGYDHSIADEYLVQLAGFYRDISNQRDVTLYQSADQTINYAKANNNLYEDIRGFELTVRKTGGAWFQGFMNYTYQVSTLGHFGKAQIYQDARDQSEYDRNTRQQSQERPIPQPYARANLNFFTPNDFGPEIAGVQPLSDWKLNVLADWREGAWLTWNPTNDPSVNANVQAKDWYNVQLRFMKSIDLKPVTLTFFVDVYNALNTRRLSLNGFLDANDYIAYFSSLHLPESNEYSNITGDDRIGDYRKPGVAYQPIELVGNVSNLAENEISTRAIYYDQNSGKYMNYSNGAWAEVSKKRMNKILDDKAYIDMPNHSYFNFLNPRQIFYGINLSFNF